MPLRPGGGRHPWRGLEKSQRTFFGKQPKRTLPTPGWGDGRGSQRASFSLLFSSNHYYKGEARFLPGCLGSASYSRRTRLGPGPSHLSLVFLLWNPLPAPGPLPAHYCQGREKDGATAGFSAHGGEGWEGGCTLTPSTSC